MLNKAGVHWCSSQFENSLFTEICSGTEAGSFLRHIDFCITQLKAQGPSRTCNESKEEEEEEEDTWLETLVSPGRGTDANADDISSFSRGAPGLRERENSVVAESHSL